jgi:hypothetical protein
MKYFYTLLIVLITSCATSNSVGSNEHHRKMKRVQKEGHKMLKKVHRARRGSLI